MATDGNTKLTGFYFPWPNLGIKLSRQWANLRSNTEKEAPLIRAAYVDPQPASANDPGNHDLSGWAIGERDFRNRFRIWYDKSNDRFSIQYNSGTESVETWDDYLSIRQTDGRVTVHGYGGLDSSVGGFYSPLPRNLAVSSTFNPASTEWQFTHNLNTKPVLWNAFNMEDKSVTPQTVDVSDPNTAYFYFAVAQAGRAMVVAEQARGEGINVSDGTNIFNGATRLGFNPANFYLSNEGHGDPVVSLQPISLADIDTSALVKVDGSNAFAADESMGGFKLTNVGAPTTGGDAANKTYVDATVAAQAVDITDTYGTTTYSNITKLTFETQSFYFRTDSSGQPIVNFRGTAGGGSSATFGSGVKYQDFSSSLEWTFNHNLGVAGTITAVYDDQGEAIIPDKIATHNVNTAYFYFGTATAGRAVIIGGPIVNQVTVAETDGTPTDYSTDKITFNSNDFYIESDSAGKPIVNFRGSSGGSGSGVTDHGALTGLTDDDHSQYLLASDATSRASFAANWLDLTDGGATTLHTHAGIGSSSSDPGFYGIVWTDSRGVTARTDRLSFGQGFYLDGARPTLNIGNLPPGSVPFTALDTDTKNVTSDLCLGLQLHRTSFAVTSDGATITATWSDNSGGLGIRTLFGSGIVQNAAAGGSLTATLTAGTDTSPQANYLYVLASTPTVLTVSTTDYPDPEATEHTRVGYALVQSAATVQTYGALVSDSTAEHVHYQNPSGTGHIAHINEWIKAQPATWKSGVAATGTINTAPTPDTVTFSTTAGVVFQGHPRTFPAFADPAALFVTNHSSGAYTRVTTMPGLTSGGAAIGGSDRIIVVLWGVINDNTGDCKLMLNLPSGYYGSNAAAIADDSKYANYTIPAAFKGTGFLIASFIYQYTTAAGGTYTLVQQTDLRGLLPSSFPGGTTAAGTEFSDSSFRINDNADATKQLAFEVSGVTTGTTRTLTVQDRSGTIALTDQLNNFYYLAVNETDGNPGPYATRALFFHSNDFYIAPNSIGQPVVNLRGSTGSGTALTVQDVDGAPTATNVNTIKFTNGSVTDDGAGVVTVTTGGGSGISTVTIGGQSFGSQTTFGYNSKDFYLSGGATTKVLNLRDTPQIYKGHAPGVIIDNFFLEPDAEHAFTVDSASLDVRAGSASVGFYIVSSTNLDLPGRPISGMDNITVSSTRASTSATAFNTMNVGDRLVMSVFAVSGAEHLVYTVRLRKTN